MTAEPTPRPRVRLALGWTTAVCVGLLAGVAGWYRLLPGVRGTMWAEDTRIFLAQRLRLGAWDSLFQPYGGYLHLGPRVLTDLGVEISTLSGYGVTVTRMSLVVVGLVAAAAYAFSGGLLRSRPARILLAMVPVLLPIAPIEVLGNLANVHAFGLFLVPLLLLYRPGSVPRTVAQCLVTAVVVLTEVQSVLFLPLLVVVIVLRRRGSWPVAAVFLAGLATQAVAFLSSTRSSEGERLPFGDVALGFLVDPVLGTWWSDSRVAAEHLVAHGPALLAVAALPFLLALAVSLTGRWDRRSLLAVVYAVGAVVVWSAGVLANGPGGIAYLEHGLGLLGADGFLRYAVVPGMFLLAGVVVAVDRLLAPGPARARRDEPESAPVPVRLARLRPFVGVAVALALVALLVVRFEPPTNGRPGTPLWSTSVADAAAWCRTQRPSAVAFIGGAPAGWGISVPCRAVRADAQIHAVPVR